MKNKLPATTLTEGLLKASIWKNIGEDGIPRYSVTFSRSYFKDDEWHTSYSHSRSELLRMTRLSRRAFVWIVDKRRADRAQNTKEAA